MIAGGTLPLEGDILMVFKKHERNKIRFYWVEKIWTSRVGTHYKLVPLTLQYKKRVREQPMRVMQDWFFNDQHRYRIEFTKVSRESVYGTEAQNERVGTQEAQQGCRNAWPEERNQAVGVEGELA